MVGNEQVRSPALREVAAYACLLSTEEMRHGVVLRGSWLALCATCCLGKPKMRCLGLGARLTYQRCQYRRLSRALAAHSERTVPKAPEG